MEVNAMERKIPIYFDSIVVESPIQENIIDSNNSIYRMKVRTFSKYANRNGSYITDAVADQLIESATNGITPVIGFFDPETKTWASHTGPTLAKAYGYVESFLGWEPFEDTDGVTRDYAVFSILAFIDYYEEANLIMGQNQSMELNENSITGDWAEINNDYYFVYTTAKMKGFCIIGSHEPCFSVSAFFSQDEDTLNTQYNKFSSLLSNLKAQVEEAKKFKKGGEQSMDENEQVTPVVEENQPEETIQVDETPVENKSDEAEENKAEEPSEFEVLQQKYEELENTNSELQDKFDVAQKKIEELEESLKTAAAEFEKATEEINTLKNSLKEYENQMNIVEENKKDELIKEYKKFIPEEEISEYEGQMKNFTYDELESKLAICFAKKQMAGGEPKVVPLPDSKNNEFALFMEKYRKNK